MLNSPRRASGRVHFAIWIPLAFLLFATVLIWITGLDLRLASRYFHETNGWHLGQTSLWYYTNRFGEMPGFYTGMAGLVILIIGLKFAWFQRWRRTSAYLFLVLLLGPGLVVNGIFKELYGRPRPMSVEQFGGPYPFLHAWEPGWGLEDDPSTATRKSFPSGHAANGFYFVVIYFVFRRQRRKLAIAGLWFGIALGFIIGFGRVVDGKHWASDLLWSFGMVYLVAYGLARALRMDHPPGGLAAGTSHYSFAERLRLRPE